MESITSMTRQPAWRLVSSLAHYERTRRQAEAASTVGRADQRLLWLLVQGGTPTLREVSDALGLEQSTVNRQVNSAVKAGLLRRSRTADSSAYVLEATDLGARLFDENARWHLGLMTRALEALPEEWREDFPDLLADFIGAYANALAEHPRPDG